MLIVIQTYKGFENIHIHVDKQLFTGSHAVVQRMGFLKASMDFRTIFQGLRRASSILGSVVTHSFDALGKKCANGRM
jgi:hypothetical protein